MKKLTIFTFILLLILPNVALANPCAGSPKFPLSYKVVSAKDNNNEITNSILEVYVANHSGVFSLRKSDIYYTDLRYAQGTKLLIDVSDWAEKYYSLWYYIELSPSMKVWAITNLTCFEVHSISEEGYYYHTINTKWAIDTKNKVFLDGNGWNLGALQLYPKISNFSLTEMDYEDPINNLNNLMRWLYIAFILYLWFILTVIVVLLVKSLWREKKSVSPKIAQEKTI